MAGFLSSSNGLVNFTLCQKSREFFTLPFVLQPNNDCLSMFFPLCFAWVLEYLMHVKFTPVYDPCYPMQTAYFKRIFNYRPIIPACCDDLISQHPFVLQFWSVIFHTCLVTRLRHKELREITPAKAQQTASSENYIKHPVYSTKYICLMEPKWQSIMSPTSFPIKLGKC